MPDKKLKKKQQTPVKPAKTPVFHPKYRKIAAGLLLCLITFAVYYPAWNGTQIWDDDGHITRPDLRSLNGLANIWCKLGTTQQYYPLVHTVFWLEYRLWGGSTLGYHLLNIALHLLSALLLYTILRRLVVPGAWFVAAVFALHPVHVESVAWMTELKNVLSGVFFLSTALAYLEFDRERKKTPYIAALILFVLGLMSKSVIAMVPVPLLAVIWWKRGRIGWQHDVIPLLPFFATGIASGLFTAWVEHTYIIGGEQSEFTLSFIERCLMAGRAFWFYLSKLAVPLNLTFIYPRWTISQTVWWQYLFPVAALFLGGVCYMLRNRLRAPFAAYIFFAAMLFPVMGFFNVYPFRFSYVADHFQYLASIGPIALGAAAMEKALHFIKNTRRFALYLIVLFALGSLTWKQSGMYANEETLYRTTIARNPGCWLAHNNLGIRSAEAGRSEEARVHFQKALEFNPAYNDAHYNLASLLAINGRIEEAIVHYQKALLFNTAFHIDANYNLGLLFAMSGRDDEAIVHYRNVLERNPDYFDALCNLAEIFVRKNRFQDAIPLFRRALIIAKSAGNEPKTEAISAAIGKLEQKIR